MTAVRPWRLARAVTALEQGGVIAYPTESVFGLGCDPMNSDAVMRLLQLKHRSVEQGLICIASDFSQLEDWITPLNHPQRATLAKAWPGPQTWLLPASQQTPRWLTGRHNTLACRVSSHPLVSHLCKAFGGAIVSTSANRHGQAPARSAQQCRNRFGTQLTAIIAGSNDITANPTPIYNLESGQQIR